MPVPGDLSTALLELLGSNPQPRLVGAGASRSEKSGRRRVAPRSPPCPPSAARFGRHGIEPTELGGGDDAQDSPLSIQDRDRTDRFVLCGKADSVVHT
jgi:hypothetical protein